MSSTTLSILAAVIVAALATLFVITNARRDRRMVDALISDSPLKGSAAGHEVEEAQKQELATQSKEVAEWVPPTPEAIGVSRRQFFNRSIVGVMTLGLSGFGMACIAFLWPNKVSGFGAKVNAGKLSEIVASIEQKKEPFYVAEGRFYLAQYPKDSLPKARNVSSYKAIVPGLEGGIVALYQKCVHLGCKVPWCKSSQWFECPCHGSRYNRVGEKKGGPAPRGLDRFVVSIGGDSVTVDTGARVLGPPVGTNTTGQEAEGPHC